MCNYHNCIALSEHCFTHFSLCYACILVIERKITMINEKSTLWNLDYLSLTKEIIIPTGNCLD